MVLRLRKWPLMFMMKARDRYIMTGEPKVRNEA